MELQPYQLLFFVAGWVCLVLLSWLSELLSASPNDDILLTTEERIASERCLALYEQFSNGTVPHLERRDVWQFVGWFWRYTRFVALRSGKLLALCWLAFYAVSCVAVMAVNLVRPHPHSLRLLLGGCDFVTFSVAPRQK